MKTQGITLMTSQTTEVKVKKKTNASDSTFENFIANNASGVNRQNTGQTNIADTKSSMESPSSKIKSSKESEDGSSSNISQSKDADKQVNNPVTKDAPKDVTKADGTTETAEVTKSENPFVKDDGQIDIEKVNEEVMAILQDILGLLPQDLQDIFDNLGMQPGEIFTGLATGEIESFSITTVQTFVMEVHGIEDPSAFLTNDLLNQEMNDIFDQLKTLLSEMMRVGVQDLEKLDPETWNTFAANLIQAVQTEQTPVVNETVAPTEEVIEDTTEPAQQDGNPDISVIIENQTSDQAGSGTGQNTGQGTGLGADDVRDAAADLEAMSRHTQTTNTQAFAESLTQALDPEATQVQDVQRQMTEMVEQVVRQVRVRMMPETTNMEIQLHPASLGRVNVQINATGQDTTARLIVENQAAKEALESGMIRLQEAFEERGLKVQAVEVTVGNFDLGLHQQNNGEEAESSNEGRRGNGGQGGQGSGDDTGAATETNETEASRRDINSTVDYTA
ncbi:MAG: flagellar hook-length control protein FliK [Eubacterium sp.]|nr:flagellar hook-length control protein FliK [Eubacterium sp.]